MKKLFKYGFLAALWSGTVGIAAAIGFYSYFDEGLPKNIGELKEQRFTQPLRIYDAKGVLLQEYGSERRIPLEFNQFPQVLKDAILSVEDRKFYEHNGVDPWAIARSAFVLVTTGEKQQGGSTITQQLARNYYLNSKKEFVRKIKEIILAIRMENVLTKDEILNLYMNKIYLGNRSYGFEAAAKTYFNKTVNELTLPEAALLAGLQQAPSRLNPIRSPAAATKRRNIVLTTMLENGKITQAQYEAAKATPWNATMGTKTEDSTPTAYSGYITELARQAVVNERGNNAYTDGYSVYLTVDIEQQKQAVLAVRSNLIRYDLEHGWRGIKDANKVFDGKWEDLSPEEQQKIQDIVYNREDIDPLKPGVIIAAKGNNATVLTRDGSTINLNYDSVSWALRNNHDKKTRGARTVAQLLQPGDLIWYAVNSGKRGNSYVLRQIPEANSGLASVDALDGKILALVGGFSYDKSSFNRAVQARVQIGSTVKPFVYASALSLGYTLATIVDDSPIVVRSGTKGETWKPKNYGSNFHGDVTIRQAIAQSINIPSVKVARDIGIDNFANNWLPRFGFNRKDYDAVNAIALGAANFTPIEMARAYSVFDNGGFLVKPYLIDHILDVKGKVVFKATPEQVPMQGINSCPLNEEAQWSKEFAKQNEGSSVTKVKLADDAAQAKQTAELNKAIDNKDSSDDENKAVGVDLDTVLDQIDSDQVSQQPKCAPRVIDASVAWLMHDALKSTVNGGMGYGGTAGLVRQLGRKDAGGKTGTTNNNRAAWFAGYYGQTVTAVYIAKDSNQSLGNRETGGHSGLPAWVYYYENLRKIGVDFPEYEPAMPSNIVTAQVNPHTGMLDPNGYTEYFIAGTEPKQVTPSYSEDDNLNEDLFSEDGTDDSGDDNSGMPMPDNGGAPQPEPSTPQPAVPERVEKPKADKQTDKPAAKPAEKPAAKPAEKPASKPAEEEKPDLF